eukprot:scaffold719_cov117-Cylindrotheca_fusiformis.AAC.4
MAPRSKCHQDCALNHLSSSNFLFVGITRPTPVSPFNLRSEVLLLSSASGKKSQSGIERGIKG